MELLNFFQDFFLWLILFFYLHIVRFFELCENTTVRTIKDYFKYCGGIVYMIIFTQVLILLGFWLLKYGSNNNI